MALVASAGCVSKSLYLAKVDEAVRFRSQAEACDRRMRQLGDLKTDLEEQVKAMDRRRAVAQLEGDRCRTEMQRLGTEVAPLRDELRKANDQVNDLRARIAVVEERARGHLARIERMKDEARAARREPDLSDVTAVLKTEVESTAGLSLGKLKGGSVALRIPHALLFHKRTPALTRSGRELLGRLADALGRVPTRAVAVHAHQDASKVPLRYRSPQELSLSQAMAVATVLLRSGLDPTRLSFAAFGALRPLSPGSDAEALAQNRRIEIVVSPMAPVEAIEVIGPTEPPRTPSP
jgi:flagellar motor protein MotB